MAKIPQFLLPRWNRRESGLVVPSSVAALEPPTEARVEPPAELLPKPAPIALTTNGPPTSLDQMAVYVDEGALDLNVSSVEDLRRKLSGVPFEPSILLAALITAKVHAGRQDVAFQLRMARDLFGDGELYKRIAMFVSREDKAVIFAEQNCVILERLLIECATDADLDQQRTHDDHVAVLAALLGCSSVAGMVADRATRAVKTPEDFLAFFIQNGAYNSNRAPLGEISRAIELFERLASRADLQVAGCPIDKWAMEDYGFTISEQLTLGFALSAITHCWDDPESEFRVHISAENFDDLLLKLGCLDRRREALELVSATRSELQAEFAATGDTAAHLAWETRPIMRHPFLRTAAAGLILLWPRALQSWLTDGVYYRLLDSAQRRSHADGGKTSNLFTSFAGGLQEAYALEIMQSVLPGERPVGGGRVYGEQAYGRGGGQHTSDVAVDLGQDLVLIEVSNRRLRADTLILGDNARVEDDIDKAIIKKIRQLDGCIEALIAGEATIPDIDMSKVHRIWPVLVTAGEITQTEELWSFIREKAVDSTGRSYLIQAKVQPLTLLDVEDYDQICALVERGHALHDLLAAKTQPAYCHLELARWLNHDPTAPAIEGAPKIVDTAFRKTMSRLLQTLDFGKGIQPEGTKSKEPSGTP